MVQENGYIVAFVDKFVHAYIIKLRGIYPEGLKSQDCQSKSHKIEKNQNIKKIAKFSYFLGFARCGG